METKKILDTVRSYFLLTLGTLIFCFAWECFMIPNNMSGGGLTGICTILQFATNGKIPVSISYIVINAVLIAVAMLAFGGRFGAKTIYCIILCSVLFDYLPTIHWLLSLPGNFLYVPEKVVIPIIAGTIEAVGISIIFNQGGSTGGTDIVALLVNKYWPVSLGKMFIYIDILIIASIMLLPGKIFADTLYGYIMMVTFSVVLDFIQMGRQSSVQLLVFSSKYEQIADYITGKMERGVTALRSIGWYTKQDSRVLLVIVRKNQLKEVTKAIHQIDGKAFVSVSQANGVYGEGFDAMKVGLEKKSKARKSEEIE